MSVANASCRRTSLMTSASSNSAVCRPGASQSMRGQIQPSVRRIDVTLVAGTAPRSCGSWGMSADVRRSENSAHGSTCAEGKAATRILRYGHRVSRRKNDYNVNHLLECHLDVILDDERCASDEHALVLTRGEAVARRREAELRRCESRRDSIVISIVNR